MKTDKKESLEKLVYTLSDIIKKKNKIVIPPYERAISEVQEKINILIDRVIKFRESKYPGEMVKNAWRNLTYSSLSEDFYKYINNFASLSGLLASKNDYYEKILNRLMISKLFVDKICNSEQYSSDDLLYNLGIMRTSLELMQAANKNIDRDIIHKYD